MQINQFNRTTKQNNLKMFSLKTPCTFFLVNLNQLQRVNIKNVEYDPYNTKTSKTLKPPKLITVCNPMIFINLIQYHDGGKKGKISPDKF